MLHYQIANDVVNVGLYVLACYMATVNVIGGSRNWHSILALIWNVWRKEEQKGWNGYFSPFYKYSSAEERG